MNDVMFKRVALIGINENAAKKLAENVRSEFSEADVEIYPCRGLCSFYAEKGGLLVGFEKQ